MSSHHRFKTHHRNQTNLPSEQGRWFTCTASRPLYFRLIYNTERRFGVRIKEIKSEVWHYYRIKIKRQVFKQTKHEVKVDLLYEYAIYFVQSRYLTWLEAQTPQEEAHPSTTRGQWHNWINFPPWSVWNPSLLRLTVTAEPSLRSFASQEVVQILDNVKVHRPGGSITRRTGHC